MKKVLKIIFILISFLFSSLMVEAFSNEESLNDYYRVIKDGKEINGQMKIIRNEDKEILYSLSPYEILADTQEYKELLDNDYNKLSPEKRRYIELISYYGYGYQNRTDEKWYTITQFLIWKYLDSSASYYFTTSLTGMKKGKYSNEMMELRSDVDYNDIAAYFPRYSKNYGDSIVMELLDSRLYEIIETNYEYKHSYGGLYIDKATESGIVSYRRLSNNYKEPVKFYESEKSCDLIKPGTINNPIHTTSYVIKSGDILLDIRKNVDVYSVESDFSNTCYELSGEKISTIKVCTSDDNLLYKSDPLPYGTYTVKEVSVGKGFKENTFVYEVNITGNNEHPSLIIDNYLIRNSINIVKKICKEEVCQNEENALLAIYDINDNLIEEVTTDINGEISFVVGLGTYVVKQISGTDGYDLSLPYKEVIIDEIPCQKELYSYFIEKPIDIPDEKDTEKNDESEKKDENTEGGLDVKEEDGEKNISLELPPNTGIKLSVWDLIIGILKTFKKIILFFIS